MLVVGTDPQKPGITLDGDDVSAEIRGPEVSLAVSPVSATRHVRELLVAQQRAIIADAVDHVGGIVVEGRDIGTVVSPDAPLKVYLTASADARAARRTKQDTAAGRKSTVDVALADVQRRDNYDSSRAVSPLKAAADAVELDNTDLDLAGTIRALLELVERRGLRVTGCSVPAGTVPWLFDLGRWIGRVPYAWQFRIRRARPRPRTLERRRGRRRQPQLDV